MFFVSVLPAVVRHLRAKKAQAQDFSSLFHLEHCLMDFQKRYEQTAARFSGPSPAIISPLCPQSYNPEQSLPRREKMRLTAIPVYCT